MPNRQIGEDIEGFGIVFLEAGASGKPVIGGKSGGAQEAILNDLTGICVDGTSLEAVAAAVIELLANPTKAHAMGQKGRRRALLEFTWEGIAEKTRLLASALKA
jgi:phosphatidylinositol alpha-1,6-mannosyltransferase